MLINRGISQIEQCGNGTSVISDYPLGRTAACITTYPLKKRPVMPCGIRPAAGRRPSHQQGNLADNGRDGRNVKTWLTRPKEVAELINPAIRDGPPAITVMKALAMYAPPEVGTRPTNGASTAPARPLTTLSRKRTLPCRCGQGCIRGLRPYPRVASCRARSSLHGCRCSTAYIAMTISRIDTTMIKKLYPLI